MVDGIKRWRMSLTESIDIRFVRSIMVEAKTRCLILCYALCVTVGWAQVSDNFDDGNDTGWTRLNFLEAFGGSVTHSFPGGNTYRIQAGASPNAEMLGQGRAGSMRPDSVHSVFRVAVDIVGTDASLEQDIGILARVTNPGLGTLNGYSATFDTDESRAYLARVDGEIPMIMDSVEIPFDPAKDYRIVFHGKGGEFLIEVFDLADLTTTIGTITGFDDLYPEGTTGLFGSAGQPTGTVDVTFDNFEAGSNPDFDQDGMSDPAELELFGNLDQTGSDDFDGDGVSNADELDAGTDPTVPGSEFELKAFLVEDDLVRVAFFRVPGKTYQLEKSSDLDTWVVDQDAVFLDLDDNLGGFATERQATGEFLRVTVSD